MSEINLKEQSSDISSQASTLAVFICHLQQSLLKCLVSSEVAADVFSRFASLGFCAVSVTTAPTGDTDQYYQS